MRLSPIASLGVTILILACEQVTPPELDPGQAPAPSLAIFDAAHDGVAGFYFLPPLSADPGETGVFEPAFLPFLTVEVCQWEVAGCVGQPVATFTSDVGSPSEVLRMGEDQDQYVVVWHTTDSDLDPTVSYRLRVRVDQLVLGFADLDVVSSGRELKQVDTEAYVPILAGASVPLTFRITDALDVAAVVGSQGGVINLLGGRVRLEFPPGAVPYDTPITVQLVGDPTQLPWPSQGPVFDLGPDGIVFDEEVSLTLAYDSSELPPGASEGQIGLYRLDGGHPFWDPVEVIAVDVSGRTVSASITGFSEWDIDLRAQSPAKLTHQFSHSSGDLQSVAELGVWMFRENNLGFGSIAKWWLNGGLRDGFRPHEHLPPSDVAGFKELAGKGVVIHEPINVLWIDYSSKTAAQARGRVEQYLEDAGFQQELSKGVVGGFPAWPLHGDGYSAWVNGSFVGQTAFEQSIGEELGIAWVDELFPAENNHGRIFPAANVGTQDNPVFYTLGAFSRESTGSPPPQVDVLNAHKFLSFRQAQSKVLSGSPVGGTIHGWEYWKFDQSWPNSLHLTTYDHLGVAVVVYEPEELFLTADITELSIPKGDVRSINLVWERGDGTAIAGGAVTLAIDNAIATIAQVEESAPGNYTVDLVGEELGTSDASLTLVSASTDGGWLESSVDLSISVVDDGTLGLISPTSLPLGQPITIRRGEDWTGVFWDSRDRELFYVDCSGSGVFWAPSFTPCQAEEYRILPREVGAFELLAFREGSSSPDVVNVVVTLPSIPIAGRYDNGGHVGCTLDQINCVVATVSGSYPSFAVTIEFGPSTGVRPNICHVSGGAAWSPLRGEVNGGSAIGWIWGGVSGATLTCDDPTFNGDGGWNWHINPFSDQPFTIDVFGCGTCGRR